MGKERIEDRGDTSKESVRGTFKSVMKKIRKCYEI